MDIFSGIIWLVIIGAFIYPFAKTVVQKRTARPPGPRPVGGPRALSESGGYEPPTRSRPDRRVTSPEVGRMSTEADASVEQMRSIRQVRGPQPVAGRAVGHADVHRIRRQLRDPGSVRDAVVLREILDRPVSSR